MQLTLTFNPQEDERSHVLSVVDAAFKFTAVADKVEQAAAVVEPQMEEQLAAPVEVDETPTAINTQLEIDVDGVPWDARIHSDAAERQTQAGRWKKKRGVDADEYAAITHELQLLASTKVGTPELPIPTLPLVTEETPLVEVAPDKFEVAPTLPVLPVVEAQVVPTTHVELMQWVATQLAGKHLGTDDVREVNAAGELPNLAALEHMGAEWINWAYESLKARLK